MLIHQYLKPILATICLSPLTLNAGGSLSADEARAPAPTLTFKSFGIHLSQAEHEIQEFIKRIASKAYPKGWKSIDCARIIEVAQKQPDLLEKFAQACQSLPEHSGVIKIYDADTNVFNTLDPRILKAASVTVSSREKEEILKHCFEHSINKPIVRNFTHLHLNAKQDNPLKYLSAPHLKQHREKLIDVFKNYKTCLLTIEPFNLAVTQVEVDFLQKISNINFATNLLFLSHIKLYKQNIISTVNQGLAQIKSLTLNYCTFPKDFFKPFISLENLKVLEHPTDNHIEDQQISSLKTLKNLTLINCDGVKAQSAWNLEKLQALKLKARDLYLRKEIGLPSLVKLDLSCSEFSEDDCGVDLDFYPKLHSLSLKECPLVNSGFQGLHHLKALCVESSMWGDTIGLKELPATLEHLQINMRNLPQDAVFDFIYGQTNLVSLVLDKIKIYRGIKYKLPASVTDLTLRDFDGFDDTSFLMLLPENLKFLTIGFNLYTEEIKSALRTPSVQEALPKTIENICLSYWSVFQRDFGWDIHKLY